MQATAPGDGDPLAVPGEFRITRGLDHSYIGELIRYGSGTSGIGGSRINGIDFIPKPAQRCTGLWNLCLCVERCHILTF